MFVIFLEIMIVIVGKCGCTELSSSSCIAKNFQFSCFCISMIFLHLYLEFPGLPPLSCRIHIEFVIFLPASYLPGRRNLCKYVLNCQPNHFLTGAHSNLFSDVLRRISEKFVFLRGDKGAFSNESNSNVCVLWKCDILRQSNIAQQRAF